MTSNYMKVFNAIDLIQIDFTVFKPYEKKAWLDLNIPVRYHHLMKFKQQ